MQRLAHTSWMCIFLFAGFAAVLTAEEAATQDHLVIPDGTEVVLKLQQTMVSNGARVDDLVYFEAVDDVVIDGRVVIARGAEAKGVVTAARKRKSFGRSGKLVFTIDVVEAVDDQNVRLRIEKTRHGKERYGAAGAITLFAGPFGFFVKGSNVEVPAGTEYTIYIDGDRHVRLAS